MTLWRFVKKSNEVQTILLYSCVCERVFHKAQMNCARALLNCCDPVEKTAHSRRSDEECEKERANDGKKASNATANKNGSSSNSMTNGLHMRWSLPRQRFSCRVKLKSVHFFSLHKSLYVVCVLWTAISYSSFVECLLDRPPSHLYTLRLHFLAKPKHSTKTKRIV